MTITLTELQAEELTHKLMGLAGDPEEAQMAGECLACIDGCNVNPSSPSHAEYMAEEMDDLAEIAQDDLGMFRDETGHRLAYIRSFRAAAARLRGAAARLRR